MVNFLGNRLNWLQILVISLSMALMMSCAKEEEDTEVAPAVASAQIVIQLEETLANASEGRSPAFLGTVDDIDQIFLSLEQGAEMLHSHVPFTRTETGFEITLEDLPLDVELIFSAIAKNANGVEIFSGQTSQTMVPDVNEILLSLYPIDDGNPNLFPSILQIAKPTSMKPLSIANVEVSFKAQPGETYYCEFTIDNQGGSYLSPSVFLTMADNSEVGTCSSEFEAPDAVGQLHHQVTIQNGQGNSTTVNYEILVNQGATGTISLSFAPVITGIAATFSKQGLQLQAKISDDGPLHEVCYSWSFNGDTGMFKKSDSNPVLWPNYKASMSGELRLQVRDNNCTGLISELVLQIQQDQWTKF